MSTIVFAFHKLHDTMDTVTCYRVQSLCCQAGFIASNELEDIAIKTYGDST